MQEVMNCNNRTSLLLKKVQTDESNTNSGPFLPRGNVLSFETPTKKYNALALPPRDSDDVINRQFAHASREANGGRVSQQLSGPSMPALPLLNRHK